MDNSSSSITNEPQLRRTRAKFTKRNKHFVFEALSQAGITAAAISFDRKGDRLLINREHMFCGEKRVRIPRTEMFVWIVPNQGRPFRRKEALEYAIFALCWDSLNEKHPAWDSNTIAFGEFRFDVATRTIELRAIERFPGFATSTHSF
jgi:hypothetical protein